MKIAYIILAHKNPKQVSRLVNVLNYNNSHFFIHIDKKSDFLSFFNAIQKSSKENIHFVQQRINVHKRGYSMVQATINGISAVRSAKEGFDHIILLSEFDYPIKSNEFIFDFLAQNKNKEFINFFTMPAKWWYKGGMQRIEKYYFNDIGNRYLGAIFSGFLNNFLPKRKFIKGFKPYGGSAWWCITENCAGFILDFIDNNPKFVKFFKYVSRPEEMFFQTILLNSKFAENVAADNFRYLNWIDMGASPKILDKNELEKLMDSDKLFARKFDINYDGEILDLIDEKILKIG